MLSRAVLWATRRCLLMLGARDSPVADAGPSSSSQCTATLTLYLILSIQLRKPSVFGIKGTLPGGPPEPPSELLLEFRWGVKGDPLMPKTEGFRS